MSGELERWGSAAPAAFQRAKSSYASRAPDGEQLERMLAHVERVAPLPVAHGRTWLSSESWLWLVSGVGVLGLALLLMRPEPQRELARAPQPKAAEPSAPLPQLASELPSAPVRTAPAPVRRARLAPAPDPLAELQLLDRARRVMASDPARALVLSEEHRRDYAQGQFAEERELLAIEALIGLHKRDAAARRARAFERAHPNSVHAHRLALILQRDAL
jgi:hypothetical protein